MGVIQEQGIQKDGSNIFPKVQHPVSDLLTEILEFQLCTFTHAIIGKSLAFICQRSRFSSNVRHGDPLSVGNKLGELGLDSCLELLDSHVSRVLVGEVEVDDRLA